MKSFYIKVILVAVLAVGAVAGVGFAVQNNISSRDEATSMKQEAAMKKADEVKEKKAAENAAMMKADEAKKAEAAAMKQEDAAMKNDAATDTNEDKMTNDAMKPGETN